MKIVQKANNTMSIIPETDFETEYLSNLFTGNEQRKVIVKSGSSLSDLVSVDIIVNNEKCPFTVPEKQDDKPNDKKIFKSAQAVPMVPTSLLNMIKYDY